MHRQHSLPHDEAMRTRLEQELLAQVIRVDQLGTFTEAINSINEGTEVSMVESSCKPWMDYQGILRVAGRLRFLAHLSPDMQSPIILAAHSPVAKEILKDIHHHDLRHTGGVRGLVGASRHVYWIVNAKRTARRVIKDCAWCKRKGLQVVGAEVALLNWTRVGELSTSVHSNTWA